MYTRYSRKIAYAVLVQALISRALRRSVSKPTINAYSRNTHMLAVSVFFRDLKNIFHIHVIHSLFILWRERVRIAGDQSSMS